MIAIIIENYAPGNKVFPGWAKKYPELASVPGESIKKDAIVLAVEEEDLGAVIKALKERGVSARPLDQLSGKEKSLYEREFPAAFSELGDGEPKQLRSFLLDGYKRLLKRLDDDKKDELKNFNHKEASVDDLDSKVVELNGYVKDLLALRDKWADGIRKLPKEDARKLREDLSRKLEARFNPAKAGLEALRQAFNQLDVAIKDAAIRSSEGEEE